jgi:LPXTG-motif cell wall-anchored protein
MKKSKSAVKSLSIALTLILFSVFTLTPKTAYAAVRTVNLLPTNAQIGTSSLYIDGSTVREDSVGGTTGDINNILIKDGQVAITDPGGIGPQNDTIGSVIYIDYSKDLICSNATIQSVEIFVTWSSEEPSPTQSNFAILVGTNTYLGYPNFDIAADTQNQTISFTTPYYGGIASSLVGGNSDGTAPQSLTEESSNLQTLPTTAQLNDPSTKIAISIGDYIPADGSNPEQIIKGAIDNSYLKVTYDDANCPPPPLDTASLAPPKTGAALTIIVIAAGTLAASGSSYLTYRKRRSSKIQSERE